MARVAAVVVAAQITGSSLSDLHAACNAIPPVGRVYQSDVGSVQARLAAPGTKVHLIHQRCDGIDTYFDAVEANNEVRITFTPEPGNPSLDTVIGPFVPDDVRCDVNGICNDLVFTMPSTENPARPYGLAGMARIVVRLKNALPGKEIAARIGELYEPSNTCVRQTQDPVFGHFTVLPRPNDVGAVTGTSDIRATLDAYGNLLLPLDHTAARGGWTTLAAFEHGFADFCSGKPSVFFGICKPFETRARIHHKIADGAHDRTLLSAFSLDGHRIAPILDHDDDGGIFGLADGAGSVVRIARRRGGGDRFDLGYLRKDSGRGPIEFSHKTAGSKLVCHLGKLQGARANRKLVAHVDHADKLMVHEVATAATSCGTHTAVVPDETTLPMTRRERIVEADEQVVATVSGSRLRAFDEDGVEQTSGTIDAATDAVIDDYPLVVQGGEVYFRTPQRHLKRWTGGAATTPTVGDTTRAAIHETHVLALDAAAPANARAFDAASSSTTPLGAKGRDVASHGDAVAVAVTGASGPNRLGVWPWSGATIGPPDYTNAVVDQNAATGRNHLGVTAGCGRGTCTTRFVIVSSEADEGRSLNADTDLADHVMRLYRSGTKTWDEPRLAASEFVTSDQFVAFRVPESEEGRDLNGDTDTDDAVLHVAAFDGLASSPVRWISTGFAASGWSGQWHRLGWRTPYVIVDRSVHFLVEESQQRTDLDGDGLLVSTLLAILDVPAQRITVPEIEALPQQVLTGQAGRVIALVGNGVSIGDGDRDGVLDPFDSCATRPNARQIDDDYDGLGDRVCDASYCDDTVPPGAVAGPPLPLEPGLVGRASEAYLATRARVEAECLARLAATHERRVDSNALCRGSFLGGASNPGALWSASQRARVAEAETGVLRALGLSTHAPAMRRRSELRAYGRRVVRVLGEAIDATTRVTLGRARLPPGLGKEQGRLVEIVTAYLSQLVVRMQRCALTTGRRGDLAERCLGRIERGRVVLPASLGVEASAFERLDASALGRTKGCAASGDASCLRCTTWRNAVRTVLTLLGETDPPAYAFAAADAAPARRTRTAHP
jgi:hypothetical protein